MFNVLETFLLFQWQLGEYNLDFNASKIIILGSVALHIFKRIIYLANVTNTSFSMLILTTPLLQVLFWRSRFKQFEIKVYLNVHCFDPLIGFSSSSVWSLVNLKRLLQTTPISSIAVIKKILNKFYLFSFIKPWTPSWAQKLSRGHNLNNWESTTY